MILFNFLSSNFAETECFMTHWEEGEYYGKNIVGPDALNGEVVTYSTCTERCIQIKECRFVTYQHLYSNLGLCLLKKIIDLDRPITNIHARTASKICKSKFFSKIIKFNLGNVK